MEIETLPEKHVQTLLPHSDFMALKNIAMKQNKPLKDLIREILSEKVQKEQGK